jgi:hypothetical protein
MKLKMSWWLMVLLVIVGFCGCMKKPNRLHEGLTEEQIEVFDFVRKLNVLTGVPENLKQSFASGSAPSDKQLAEYSKYFYGFEEPITVEGNQATVNIKITQHGTTTEKAKLWTFVKEGDKWKIKNAPLN